MLEAASWPKWSDMLVDYLFTVAHIPGGPDQITKISMMDLEHFVENAYESSQAVQDAASAFQSLKFVSPATPAGTSAPGAPPGPRPTAPAKRALVSGSGSQQINLDNQDWYEAELLSFAAADGLWLVAESVYKSRITSGATPGSGTPVVAHKIKEVVRDAAFLKWADLCYDIALVEGAGFKPWVYKLWHAVKESLPDAMRSQVASTRTGDLKSLLQQLRLAVNKVEDIQPQILKAQMWASTMEKEGKNDTLTYISWLTLNRDRLKAVASPLADADLQGMLIHGLDDDIFSTVKDNYEVKPANSFDELCATVKSFIVRTKVATKLAAIKQNQKVTVFSAVEQQQEFNLAFQAFKKTLSPPPSPQKKKKGSLDKPCWLFQTGECQKGTDCRFGHFISTGSAAPGGSSGTPGASCKIHGAGHSDAECRSQKKKVAGPAPPQGSAPPGGPSDAILQRLFLAMHGEHKEYTCVAASHFCGAVMDARYKELILSDSCATTTCGRDITRAIPGTVRPHFAHVSGMGSVGVTQEFDMFIDGIVDPHDPDGVQHLIRVTGVLHTPDIPFLLILCRSRFHDKGCRTILTEVSEAAPGRKAITEERMVLKSTGDHLYTALSDPENGLMFVCRKVPYASEPDIVSVTNPLAGLQQHGSEVSYPTLSYDGQSLKQGNIDYLPADPNPIRPSRVSHVAEEFVSLPRQTAVGRQKCIDDLAALHSRLNHAAGFGVCGRLLRVPVPPELKCLICKVANPKRAPINIDTTYRPMKRSEAFSADWVPVAEESYEGFTGYFIIVELHTHYMFFFPAKTQGEWCEIWEKFVNMVEAHEHSTRAICILLSDQAMCFKDCGRCAKFCASRGIRQVFSAKECQWMNISEGMGRHPKKIIGVLMVSGGLDVVYPKLWPQAGHAAVGSVNFLPSASGTIAEAHGPSRHDLWHGVATPIEAWLLRQIPFASLMTVMEDDRILKAAGFSPKTIIGAFLFHDPNLTSNRIFDIEAKKLINRAAHECTSFPANFPFRKGTLLAELLGQTPIRPAATPAIAPRTPVPESLAIVGGVPPPRRSDRVWQPSQEALLQIANQPPKPPNPQAPVRPLLNFSLAHSPDQFGTLRLVRPGAEASRAEYFQFRGATQKALRKFIESRVQIEDVSLVSEPPKTPVMPDDPTLQPRLEYLFTISCPAKALTPAQLQSRLPSNIWEALDGPDSNIWRSNLEAHNAMLKRNRCFGPAQTEKPQGIRVFKVPLLFKIKTTADEVMEDAIPPNLLKPRALIRGDQFKPDVHYDKKFVSSKHVRPESVKIIMTHAVMTGKVPAHGDVPNAYYGTEMFPKGIWVQLPDGYDPDSQELSQRNSPAKYSELLGTLPGCPQGGYLFEKRLIKKMRAIGYTSDPSDDRMMRRQLVWQEHPDFVGVFVDDLGMGTDLDWRAAAALESSGEFGIGGEFPGFRVKPMTTFLGMDVEVVFTKYERSIFFSHGRLLRDFVARRGINERHSAKTPQVPGKEVSKKDCPSPEVAAAMAKQGLHRSDFQSDLMVCGYTAGITRFDAKKTVRDLATVMNNPGEAHFVALDHFLRWIKGTLDHGVEFVHTPASPDTPQIEEYSDSSHGDCPDTCGSTQGGVVYINQSPICAVSKVSKAALASINVSEFFAKTLIAFGEEKRDFDPLARIELSDFMALTGAAQSALWIQRFLKWVFDKPIKVRSFTDNSGVEAILKGRSAWETSKTILHKIEVAKAVLESMETECEHVDSADNPANSLTKQVASAETSRSELLHLAAPKGKSPRIRYGTTQAFALKDQVIYSNKKPPGPAIMLSAVAGPGDHGPPSHEDVRRVFVLEQTANPPGYPFVFPMLYVQDSTPMGQEGSDRLLSHIQHLIQVRRSEDGCDGDAVLDEITRVIAEARAQTAAQTTGQRTEWRPLMSLPELKEPPPPPSGPRPAYPEDVLPQTVANSPMVWPALSQVLVAIREGTLDNLTEEAALRWLALLDRVKRHEDNFSLMLAQRGLCVETLAENPRITDFDHFLPNGATHWAARGAYGCTICLIPAQPSAVQYVQHLLGKKHKETFERLISYVASFVYPDAVIEPGSLCKICLKVTRRAMEEHERSSRHKVSLRAWPQTPRPQQVDVNMA
jgi:hypothetical protein